MTNRTVKITSPSDVEMVNKFSNKYIKRLKNTIHKNKKMMELKTKSLDSESKEEKSGKKQSKNSPNKDLQKESAHEGIQKIEDQILNNLSSNQTTNIKHKINQNQPPVSNFNTEYLPSNSAFECYRRNPYSHSTIYEEDEDQASDTHMEEAIKENLPSQNFKVELPLREVEKYAVLCVECNEVPSLQTLPQKKPAEFNRMSYNLPLHSTNYEESIHKLFPPVSGKRRTQSEINIKNHNLLCQNHDSNTMRLKVRTDVKPQTPQAQKMTPLHSLSKKLGTKQNYSKDISNSMVRKMPSLQFIRLETPTARKYYPKRNASMACDCLFNGKRQQWHRKEEVARYL